MFLALWIILAYIIPVIIYFINSFKSQNKIKINNKTVLESYTIFKDKVVELQGRVKYVNEESDGAYLLIFSDMCLCTLKMHEVFCTKKRENEIIIKSVFRIGPTVNDMDKKISLYEYLMITDIGKKILRFSYDNALKADCDLLNSDYQKISLYLEELQSLPKHLNIE